MKSHYIFKLITQVFILLFLFGCNTKQYTPVYLVFGLKSYLTIEEVEYRIIHAGGTWKIIEKNVLSTSDIRPKYEYIRFETDVFSDEGFRGRTHLSFYNGKLMSVWFYANDWDKYKSYLADKREMVINDNKWENASNDVHSWINVDHENRYYIAWEDLELASSMKNWIEKYS